MPGGGSNPASAFSGTTAKTSLGPTFSYLVDATLWLSKANQIMVTDREDLYVAEIFKSRKTVLFPLSPDRSHVVLNSTQATGWCFLELAGGAFRDVQLEPTAQPVTMFDQFHLRFGVFQTEYIFQNPGVITEGYGLHHSEVRSHSTLRDEVSYSRLVFAMLSSMGWWGG